MNAHHLASELIEGNKTALARSITYVESSKKEHKVIADEILHEILPFSGHSIRIGITGVPGVGKSTFIESLGMMLVQQGKKVAVLAIDPTSSKSQGSILGDKVRMKTLSAHENAFIRPTAAGSYLGGVAIATRSAILLCEAAGYDVILIETVGVGQSETAVYEMTDFFLLLMLSGAGDELQGIKRGIMEMCDLLVINKADGDNLEKAKLARNEYARALHFYPKNEYGWSPKVLMTSARNNVGFKEIWDIIEKYILEQKSSGGFERKRILQNKKAFSDLVHNGLMNFISQNSQLDQTVNDLLVQIQEGQITPYHAYQYLMSKLKLTIKID